MEPATALAILEKKNRSNSKTRSSMSSGLGSRVGGRKRFRRFSFLAAGAIQPIASEVDYDDSDIDDNDDANDSQNMGPGQAPSSSSPDDINLGNVYGPTHEIVLKPPVRRKFPRTGDGEGGID